MYLSIIIKKLIKIYQKKNVNFKFLLKTNYIKM